MAGDTTMSSSGSRRRRAPRRRCRQLGDALAAAAVLLGQVDAEEAGVAAGLPQLGGLLAGAGLLHVVVWPKLRTPACRPTAQELLLLALDEVHGCSPCGQMREWLFT